MVSIVISRLEAEAFDKHLSLLIPTAVDAIKEKEEATEKNGNCRHNKYPI